MTRLFILPFLAVVFIGLAHAGSITAPGIIGGLNTESSSPANAFFNPGALGASDGIDVLADVQFVHIHMEATTTRNKGIDPNTDSPYSPAVIDTWVPVFLIGASATLPVLDDRITLGFAATDPFVGGGDYLDDDQTGPPYAGHQRYSGIETEIVSLALSPAIGVRLFDGVHIGGGATHHLNSFSILQATDPFGFEGTGDTPYQNDIILEGDASGGHWVWSAGVFVDKLDLLQVGLSYTSGGVFEAEGDAELTFPKVLVDGDNKKTIPADMQFSMPLPAIWRVTLASEINEKLRLGMSAELQMWGACCKEPEGDVTVTLLSKDGDIIDEGDGLGPDVDVDRVRRVPRRLRNSVSALANAGYWITDDLFLVGGVAWDRPAVPDFAVSPTNLDFNTWGGMLAVRYRLVKPLILGVSYGKFFPAKRTIDHGAWGVEDPDDPDYVDNRFSPEKPYRPSTNGEYRASVDAIGVRMELAF